MKLATNSARLIMPHVPRRIHVALPLSDKTVRLDAIQSHHLRDVLRLKIGDAIEAFNDAGDVAQAIISRCDVGAVELQIESVERAEVSRQIIIASAIPKGDRADWMIEKLSEIGVSRFIPLATSRSVVLPTGKSKRERWQRIATESAKQSRRVGVMSIDELTELDFAIDQTKSIRSILLATEVDASPLRGMSLKDVALFIGPEGGWDAKELSRMQEAGLTAARLTRTILRVETAAIIAAGIVATEF